MTYAEAIQFLYGLRLFGAILGLETPRKLAALAGNPQNQLRFIHVAGTNGKGSTCAMLEGIYRAAGLRVGLFTSPHLVSFRERIQVNRRPIPETEVAWLVTQIRPLLKQFPVNHHPTFFEVITVMALKFFAEQKCDLVIWETGLGGRLDATNIVTPLASVITNIAFDHQQWLGDTLDKIAAEKAGIIKPGVPVITATDKPEALVVIEKIAREKNAPLTKINSWEGRRVAVPNQNQSGSPTWQPSPIEVLPLLGDHQKINAALALATVEVLQNKIPVNEENIRAGLQSVNWPGRLQLITRDSGQKILLDGAHNVAGAQVLRKALENIFLVGRDARPAEVSSPNSDEPAARPYQMTLILGVLQDKDWRQICGILAPLASRIFTVPVSSERSSHPNQLMDACRTTNPMAEIVACDSLRDALEKIPSHNFVVITGSLYLVGEALELLGLFPANTNERGLNEWTSTPSAPA